MCPVWVGLYLPAIESSMIVPKIAQRCSLTGDFITGHGEDRSTRIDSHALVISRQNDI